jgi:hypothetical protein
MPKIASQQRFDDVGDTDEDGYVDYAYHGFNYVVEVEGQQYNVRIYDDEPGVASVIGPTDARHLSETPALLTFLAKSLNCSRFQLYHGTFGYREVDPVTLDFLERGT